MPGSQPITRSAVDSIGSFNLRCQQREEWVFHQHKPDLSSTDDNKLLSLVVSQLSVILEPETRQICTSHSDVCGTGYQSGQEVLKRVDCELQGKPLQLLLKVCWGSSYTGCALQVPTEYRAIDSDGSASQATDTRQCDVLAAKQIRVPVDCDIPFIISSFLFAWKNEKWFANMLRI